MGPESMIVDTLGVYCTYKEVTVTNTCMINNQRQIRLKCKLLIRKQHNHCATPAINTSNQLYGVHCGALLFRSCSEK